MSNPDNSSARRILLAEGSSTSARQVLYGVGPRHHIGILDSNPICLCRFSRFVRRYHRCPPYATRPDEYLHRLLGVVTTYGYEVVFPTHEQVYLLSRFREEVARRVAVAVPPFDALRRMQSKSDFVRVMTEAGIPVPPTRFVRSLAELGEDDTYPCYIKLPHGTAGNGVRRVRSPAEVGRIADELGRSGRLRDVNEIVVQQPAPGTPSVVQAIFQHGQLVAAHCAEAVRTGIGGSPMVRVSARHPIVLNDMRRLGAHLQWHGPMFLEYAYDHHSDRAQYFEANPRIGEPMNALFCGLNLPEIWLRVALDETVEPRISYPTGVRSHVGFVLLLASALDGATRGALLREWRALVAGNILPGRCENELVRPGDDWLSVAPAVATAVQVLAFPGRARHIVRKTVDSYALSEGGARRIDAMTWPASSTV